MFTVYHSNQVDLLKTLVSKLIEAEPLSNPLQQELILVQSPGMAQWLKLELAKEQKIAANIEFPLPATFIWRMFTQLLPDVPERSFFNKEAMTWKLMKILPSLLARAEFEELNYYLAQDDDDIKLFQLAGKIADIYDQYLMYRPEWINAWESEQEIDELKDEKKWQAILWRALYDYTLNLEQSPYHRANLYDDFIQTLRDYHNTPAPLQAIKRIFIFGVSALPPRYLAALKALGEHIDVHYMFTNPCRYFWGDIRDKRYLAKYASKLTPKLSRVSEAYEQHGFLFDAPTEDLIGNSLLSSMGKLGRDNLLLLSELECQEVDSGFVDIRRDCLLHHIQADILDLIEAGDILKIETSEHKKTIKKDDRSLMLEVCHSPLREVEVLYDRLLSAFEQDNSLTPRDIIVMVADINAYSPAIEAVFGNAPSARFIPFSISDRTAAQENPILDSFLRLLSLPKMRCSAAELLELLEIPAVLRRFKLDNRQFDKIMLWVEESGVRWGLDPQTATHFALPCTEQNTWLFGLSRMLLGYALPSDVGLFNHILPYDEVQGLEADIAGKLAEFFQKLMALQNTLSCTRTGNEWALLLSQLFDDFFALENEEEEVGQLIRKKLATWVTQLDDAGFDQALSLDVVRHYLQDTLDGDKISQRFLAGQVNFCTLMPMRSIPFKLVCLLGMNEGDYPRTIAPLGFDLMAGRARAGDRSRRDDDRYLFLEAIQSAQQQLYISYVGRSILDNHKKEPSVLVNELLEYCTQGYCLEGDQPYADAISSQRLLAHLIHVNALVPFSPNAFSATFPSYANEWLAAATRRADAPLDFLVQTLSPESLEHPKLELAELQRFWRLPVQYFFNRRLKVFFNQEQAAVLEIEPFYLDNLSRFKLRDALLTHLIKHGSSAPALQDFYQRQKASGMLPVNYFGELSFESEQQEIIKLYEQVMPYLQLPMPAIEINIKVATDVGDIQLQGWLSDCYQNGRVLYRSGKIRAQDKLAAWLDHLCLCAQDKKINTYLFGLNEAIYFNPLDNETAQQHLAMYIDYYFSGQHEAIAYLPNTANAAMTELFDLKTQQWNGEDEARKANAIKKMQTAFNGDNYYTLGEKRSPYITRCWPEDNPAFFEIVLTLGKDILLPAIKAGQLIDPD